MHYNNINQLRTAISNFRYENGLSGSKKAVFQALSKLDNELAWDLYSAPKLSKFIDKFLI